MTTLEGPLAATRQVSGSGLGLTPLRAELLRLAEAEAARLVHMAEAEGASAVAQAGARAEELLLRAREQGAADGAALRALEASNARGAARARVLSAQRQLHEELRRRARHTVRELLCHPTNRDALAAALRARLGGDAEVRDSHDGGLTAHSPHGGRIDGSVAALVDRALADLDLEPLWSAS